MVTGGTEATGVLIGVGEVDGAIGVGVNVVEDAVDVAIGVVDDGVDVVIGVVGDGVGCAVDGDFAVVDDSVLDTNVVVVTKKIE